MGKPAAGTLKSAHASEHTPTFWWRSTATLIEVVLDWPDASVAISRIPYSPLSRIVGSSVPNVPESAELPLAKVVHCCAAGLSKTSGAYCSTQVPPLTVPVIAVACLTSVPSIDRSRLTPGGGPGWVLTTIVACDVLVSLVSLA